MLNIISTLCNELNYHQVTVTCWVSGSLRQVYLIWYAHFFCWHYNKVLSCSVPYKSPVTYIAKIHQSLKVSMFNQGTEHTHGVQHTYSYRNVLLLSVTGSNVDAVLRHVFVVVAKTRIPPMKYVNMLSSDRCLISHSDKSDQSAVVECN